MCTSFTKFFPQFQLLKHSNSSIASAHIATCVHLLKFYATQNILTLSTAHVALSFRHYSVTW